MNATCHKSNFKKLNKLRCNTHFNFNYFVLNNANFLYDPLKTADWIYFFTLFIHVFMSLTLIKFNFNSGKQNWTFSNKTKLVYNFEFQQTVPNHTSTSEHKEKQNCERQPSNQDNTSIYLPYSFLHSICVI